MSEDSTTRHGLATLYHELSTEGEVVPQPQAEEWSETINRMHVTGRVNEITNETYWYFLEVLPPKLMRSNFFAFAEGQEPLTLFWEASGKHYCRRLTDEETNRFCEASGLSKNYGS